MSFLKQAVANKPVGKTLGKPTPKPTKPLVPPTVGGGVKKPSPVPKKPNPLVKPPVKPVEKKEEVKEDIVEELDAKEIDLNVNPEPKQEEVKEEVTKDAPVEEVKEEKVEEKKPVVEETEAPKEEKEPEVKEEKKTTSRKSSRSKKKEESTIEKKDDLPKADIDRIEDYMTPVVLPTIETWEEEKAEINEVMATLEIDADMNPAVAKVLLADMATAYGSVNKKLTHYKTQYENLTGKDGIIECVKAIHGQGKNAEERKYAATHACMNYCKPGEKEAVNLFEYEYLVRERFYFYENTMRELEFKRQLLITFNGMLNAESRI